jgi:hypothetical protein
VNWDFRFLRRRVWILLSSGMLMSYLRNYLLLITKDHKQHHRFLTWILSGPSSVHSLLLSLPCRFYIGSQFCRPTHVSQTWSSLSIAIFGVVAPCRPSLIGGYQRFGGRYRLHLQGSKFKIAFSETLLTTYQTTRRQNPEDPNRNLHRLDIWRRVQVMKLLQLIVTGM